MPGESFLPPLHFRSDLTQRWVLQRRGTRIHSAPSRLHCRHSSTRSERSTIPARSHSSSTCWRDLPSWSSNFEGYCWTRILDRCRQNAHFINPSPRVALSLRPQPLRRRQEVLRVRSQHLSHNSQSKRVPSIRLGSTSESLPSFEDEAQQFLPQTFKARRSSDSRLVRSISECLPPSSSFSSKRSRFHE